MKNAINLPVQIAAIYCWLGFLGGISFMEAWLKFKAPGITVPLGLGIGRLVFNALNKVEWLLLILLFIGRFQNFSGLFKGTNRLLLVLLSFLIIQSFMLLPMLDTRAEQLIQGKEIPASYLHVQYVLIEVIKLGTLFVLGRILFKQFKNTININ